MSNKRLITISTTAIIVALTLGYIPLGLLMTKQKGAIRYEISMGKQYDVQGEETMQAEVIDVMRLEDDSGLLVSGLSLERRYTELLLDTQGITPSTVEVTAEYTGEPDQLWLHIGGLYEKSACSVPMDLKPLQCGEWRVVKDEDLSLFQREQRYADINEFFGSTVAENEDVVLAGLTPGDAYSGFIAKGNHETRELLGMPLRGAHKLELIVCDERLRLAIGKRDLNRVAGSDDIMVTLKRGVSTVYNGVLPDDGNVLEDALISADEQSLSVDLNDIENGIYSLEIEPRLGGDDFIITSVQTDAPKSIIKDNVFLFEPRETGPEQVVPAIESIDIFLDSPPGVLTARTWHPIIQRSVFVDNTELIALRAAGAGAPFQSGSVTLGEGLKALRLTNPGSLILQYLGGGFSFARGVSFDPSFPHLKPILGMATVDAQLVLAKNYEPPTIEGTGRRVFRSIPLEGLAFPGGKIKLILEKTGDGDVTITSLSISVARE